MQLSINILYTPLWQILLIILYTVIWLYEVIAVDIDWLSNVLSFKTSECLILTLHFGKRLTIGAGASTMPKCISECVRLTKTYWFNLHGSIGAGCRGRFIPASAAHKLFYQPETCSFDIGVEAGSQPSASRLLGS